MTIKYPSELDTDAELPRVNDAATEITADLINQLREAIFAIERTIGVNPEGTTASLVNRISASLNEDGTFKASALVAAGLIALPITNSMIGASAAIEESKLDLDIATQLLQDQISSNDVDIRALQDSFTSIINDFNQHVDGTDFNHDSFAILLDTAFPSSTPPDFTGLSATNVGDALIEINDNFVDHASTGAIAAHQAGNIATSGTYGGVSVINVQQALDALDDAATAQLNYHRDDHHANGILNWANSTSSYNSNLQLIPTTVGSSSSALIVTGPRNVIDFISVDFTSTAVRQHDMLVVADTLSAGTYSIDDIGPRDPVGSKPALTSSQLEISGTFPDDGYVSAQIFGQSSTPLFKTTLAATVHQSDIRVDSIQCARPNSAKALSLGLNPDLVDSSTTLVIEAGVAASTTRSITITDLHLNRAGASASPITRDTIVERINHVLQNRTDGNAFPAAAYRVGDELMIAHNWDDSADYTLRIRSTGTGNLELGFDGYGANILDSYLRPTTNGKFFVGGQELTNFRQILSGSASISGQIVTLNSQNPLELGVKIGHLLHIKTHATDTNALGTYLIIAVSSTSVTVHKDAGITATSSATVEIYHDAAPLDDFNAGGSGNDRLINIYADYLGRLHYNQRLEYSDNIANLAIVDASDNFIAGEHTLTAASSGSVLSLTLTSDGISGNTVRVPSSVSGKFKVYAQSNIEWIEVEITSPVGSGSNDIIIYDQVDEEECLEICTVRLNGITTASNIVDKRLFGTVGLDEVREDYTQAFIETPFVETRSSGIVFGFDIIQDNYQDLSIFSSTDYGVLLRGGVAYVGGARVDIPTLPVMIPSVAGTYFIAITSAGSYSVIDSSDYSLTQMLDGYNGHIALVAKTVHDGTAGDPLTTTDLRFFINNLDDKVELLVDTTNRRIGNFASAKAAIDYVSSYPHQEKFKIKVCSRTNENVEIPTGLENLTLEIDGSIGSLTVRSPCRVLSASTPNRRTSFITGSLTTTATCSEFYLENVSVVGAATFGNTGALRINSCVFDAVVDINVSDVQIVNTIQESTSTEFSINASGEAYVHGCSFAGTRFTTATDNIVISSSYFNGANGFLTITTPRSVIKDCLFDGSNGSGSGAISVVGSSVFQNCAFVDFTYSSGALIGVNSSTALVSVNDSLFKSFTLSSTATIATLTSGALRFNNCDFDTSTFGSNPAVICSDFEGNRLIGTVSGNMLVRILNGGRFSKNRGVHAVTTGTTSADGPIIISENYFPACTLGYNVDISQAPTTALSQAIVISNIFADVQNDAILCGANTQYALITKNVIEGAVGSNAINLGAGAFQIHVEGNVLDCPSAFSSSTTVMSLFIENNFITAAGTTTLQVATLLHMAGNKIESAHALVITGSGEFIFTGNVFGSLTLPACTGNFTGNSFRTLTFAGNITNASFVGNKFDEFAVSGTPTADSIRIANNFFDADVSGWNTLTWANSQFIGNTFSTSTDFSLRLNAGNQFSNNTLTSSSPPDITLVAGTASTIEQLVFSKNHMAGGNLICAAELESCTISENIEIGLNISGSLSHTTVINNKGSATGWSFTGDMVSSSISFNNFQASTIDVALISDLIIAKNELLGLLTIETSGAIANLSVLDNYGPTGAVTIASGTTMARVSVKNNMVEYISLGTTSASAANSIAVDDNMCTSTVTVGFTGTVRQSSFSRNKVFGGSIAYSFTATCTQSYIAGNTSTGDISVTGSSIMAHCVIADNISSGLIDLDFVTVEDCSFNNNNAQEMTLAATTEVARCVLSGNIVTNDFTLPDAAIFGTDADQSKFFFNYAGTWVSTGTIDTTASTIIFPWGNTGSAPAIGVTFGGTTATNTGTANNLAGGIDT